MRALCFLLLGCFASVGSVLAQASATEPTLVLGANVDSSLIERSIVEAKWRYEYTMHVASNTVIHEAGNDYDFFLYFRYDYTAEEFLNGRYERKAWALAGDQLFYPFRNVNVFRVTEANREDLSLEFTQPNSKGHYQYHFVRVNDDDAPFVKPVNQLPTVLVESVGKQRSRRRRMPGDEVAGVKKSRRWWPFANRRSKTERVAERAARKAKKQEERDIRKGNPTAADLTIELNGGGYFGGIDPVMRDYTIIKPGGRLVKEFKSVQTDLQRKAVDLDIEAYNELAEFIDNKGFFDMERTYECNSPMCLERMRQKPTPVPLRMAVRLGKRSKVVNITIWGLDERGIRYVEYPDELEEVIQAVLKVSNSAEYSFARK